MSIKSDKWIRHMAQTQGMISPFEPQQIRYQASDKIVSYGTSSYGYDVRCSNEFKIFTNINSAVVDPKNFNPDSFVDLTADVCIIPPNSFALARSVEYFVIPRRVLVICLGKSTYARCGIIVNVTPLEPEWEGHITLEFPIRHRCQPKFMPMKVSRSCSFWSRMKSVKRRIKIAVANIKVKKASLCRLREIDAEK